MNIIYIFGIAILLMGGTDALIEDKKTDKNSQQRILLRKLQNFQETKPLMWNEVLADVLVNKIGIFSFKTQDKENVIKYDAPVTKERTILTDFFSQVFFVYKKFIYDAFVGKRKENDDKLTIVATRLDPKNIQNDSPKIESEEVIQPNEITFAEGPKSEVELLEPKYHGKITLEESNTENPGSINVDLSKKGSVGSNVQGTNIEEVYSSDHEVGNSVDLGNKDNVNPVKEGSVDTGKEEIVACAEGFVKSENGNCVNNSSRLILAIPSQCPLGYRKDRLGYCRMIFNF